MSIETEITRIKTNIASAYTKAEEKGATLPEVQNSENLPATIESITGGGDEWQPEPDWWDIDKILEEDTEEYAGKMIMLLNGSVNLSNSLNINGADKIVTSDGSTYTQSVTHTWDINKDKECSLGYSTRYIIWYYSKQFSTWNPTTPNNGLYIICKNISFNPYNINSNNYLGNSLFAERIKYINCSFDVEKLDMGFVSAKVLLKNVKFINCKFNSVSYTFGGVNQSSSTKDINDLINLLPENYFISTGRYSLQGFKNIIYLPRYVLAQNCDGYCNRNFANCYELVHIGVLDLTYATTLLADNFASCYSLKTIDEVYGIKLSGLSFKDCTLLNHDTLIRILNALYDYSGSEDTYTITLGATNLAKLTEEEIAIGTNKGWTIS